MDTKRIEKFYTRLPPEGTTAQRAKQRASSYGCGYSVDIGGCGDAWCIVGCIAQKNLLA